MIVLIDNYDSFTYNLYQYLCELGAEVRVIRNDAATVAEIVAMAPERVVLSPGPCTPKEAGICVPLIHALAGKVPLLGVCLGHQAIGAAYGGEIVRAPNLMHGKVSAVHHTGQGVFQGLAVALHCNPLSLARCRAGDVAGRARSDGGDGGRPLDGLPPPGHPLARRRPVPPGKHSHRAWASTAGEFP